MKKASSRDIFHSNPSIQPLPFQQFSIGVTFTKLICKHSNELSLAVSPSHVLSPAEQRQKVNFYSDRSREWWNTLSIAGMSLDLHSSIKGWVLHSNSVLPDWHPPLLSLTNLGPTRPWSVSCDSDLGVQRFFDPGMTRGLKKGRKALGQPTTMAKMDGEERLCKTSSYFMHTYVCVYIRSDYSLHSRETTMRTWGESLELIFFLAATYPYFQAFRLKGQRIFILIHIQKGEGRKAHACYPRWTV